MTYKNHHWLSLLIAMMIVVTGASIGIAQNRNIMTVRFDTLSIPPGQTDVFVNAYYSLVAPKPHNIRGYEARFSYDSTKMRIVEIITDGTATANLGFVITNPAPPKAAVIADDQSQEIDLKNPVLFRFRASVSFFLKDTAWIRWDTDLTRLPPYDGIDTLIMQDGWIRIQRPSIDVTIASPKAVAQSDSVFVLPFDASSLTDAKLSHARFGFAYDSSALTLLNVSSGIPQDTVTSFKLVAGDSASIDVSASAGSSMLTGGKGFLNLTFRARHRTDTLITKLSHLSFVALNSDAQIGKVTETTDTILIFGHKDKPSAVNEKQELRLSLFPNPARNWISVSGAGGADWKIIDLLGSVVLVGKSDLIAQLPPNIAGGAYLFLVVWPDGHHEERMLQVLR